MMHGGTLGTWGLVQIGVDIFLGLGVFVMAMRLSRAPKDDPRLSRGLQLLQSKIAVLEDLSDRTEAQVQQMSIMLDQKARDVQSKIQAAERQVHALRASMDRSLEVAQIFQDKIPHQEIIERQNTIKYVQAARLAHQGKSVEEISATVDLPKGEIEFISKVNREHLLFSEDSLPPWAQQQQSAPPTAHLNSQPTIQQAIAYEGSASERAMNSMPGLDVFSSATRELSAAFDSPRSPASLEQLGEEFRKFMNPESTPAQPTDSWTSQPTFAEPVVDEIIFNSPYATEIAATTAPPPSPALEEARKMAMSMPGAPAPRAAAPRAATPAAVAANPILNQSQRMAQARGKAPNAEPVIRKVEFRRLKDGERT
jgi:hypothetical protein